MLALNHSRSWLELLADRAVNSPHKVAYRNLTGRGVDRSTLTYGGLFSKSSVFAKNLQPYVATGDRALILLSSEFAYLSAFFGSMLAGCIPVTGYKPRAIQQLQRAYSIIKDCRPSVIVTDSATKDMIEGVLIKNGFKCKILLSTYLDTADASDIAGNDWLEPPQVDIDSTAFLQYTSGSTSDPKGVQLSHLNLLHNCQLLVEGMGFCEESVVASWLPFHHDMGLIGKILCSLYAAVPCNFISPTDFIKRPVKWLEVISEFKCTISGAPNFAYDLCVSRVTDDELEKLDLSSWRVAWNGAEHVRHKTLSEFSRKFAPTGFRHSSHHPCYGLAEATLFVSAQALDKEPVCKKISQKRLGDACFSVERENDDTLLDYVSIGRTCGDAVVKIVDPSSRTECAEGQVGELWTSSKSVGNGYWEKKEESLDIFEAEIVGGSGERYLRTGDLAAVYEGNLYIVGRIKDVFVVAGVNVYPSDIEQVADYCSPNILKTAVFASNDELERNVEFSLVCELAKTFESAQKDELDGLALSIANSVQRSHELMPKDILFVKRGELPKTTSGKIQRSRAKQKYFAGEFDAIYVWTNRFQKRKNFANDKPSPKSMCDPDALTISLADIVQVISDFVSVTCGLNEREIDKGEKLSSFGLVSLQIHELISVLESKLARQIDAQAFYKSDPTIEELALRIIEDHSAVSSSEHHGKYILVRDKFTQAVDLDDDFVRYVNPEFGRKLAQLKLDKRYVRGEGLYLYDENGSKYLDFLSQYGALPFGHNAPKIWQKIEAFRAAMRPNFVQPSFLCGASRLAKTLISLAPSGIDHVTFTNSGAESIESAIKIAQSTTGRRRVLSVKNGFHGKTLAALSATGREKYRKAFGVFKDFDHVELDNIQELSTALETEQYCAFIIEPIQGEAGIICVNKQYLLAAQALCRQTGTVFVVDEVQTGIGRTGYLFYSDYLGLSPDIITLAKGLSGGLVPIGACLSSSRVFNEEFASKHTSTYAGNGLACEVAIAALEILCENDFSLLAHVRQLGAQLKRSLRLLQQKYPQFIREVRGEGLMLGMQVNIDRYAFGSGILASVAEEEFLTSLLMSYLLNKENIRIAFTLNKGNVLRIQPPLTTQWEECEIFLEALDRTFAVLALGNIGKLTAHLVDIEDIDQIIAEPYCENFVRPKRNSTANEFAFLLHPLTEKTYVDFDRSMGSFNRSQLIKMSGIFGDNFETFLGGECALLSDEDKTITGSFWIVPRTAKAMINMPRSQALVEIQEGLDKAVEAGARYIGLGAYTSSVSDGGLSLDYPENITVTTGNTYTTLASFQSVIQALSLLGRQLCEQNVVIVGATGAIGKALVLLFAPFVKSLALVGNSKNSESSLKRMSYAISEAVKNSEAVKRTFALPSGNLGELMYGDIEDQCYRLLNSEYLTLTNELSDLLPSTDILLTATNAPDLHIPLQDFKEEAIVCDISRPANITKSSIDGRPDIFYFDGGVIDLPYGNVLGLHTDLKPNQSYACMAETMITALEADPSLASLGADITIDRIAKFKDLARNHGFKVHIPSIEKTAKSTSI